MAAAVSVAADVATPQTIENPASKLDERFQKILQAAGLDLAKTPASIQIQLVTQCGDQAVFFSKDKATLLYLKNMDKAVIRFEEAQEDWLRFTDRFTLADFSKPTFEIGLVKMMVAKALK